MANFLKVFTIINLNKMNKLIKLVLLVCLLLPTGLKAQDVSTPQSPKSEYPILENKLRRSNEDVTDEKKSISAKFWLSRAELMFDIYNVNRKYLEGQQKLTITFSMGKEKEILQEEKGGELYETYVYDRVNVVYKGGNYYNYIETSKIYEEPLNEAKICLAKAQELDVEAKLTKKIKSAYATLSELYTHNGSRVYFYNNDNQTAYNCFVSSLEINALPISDNKIDTALMFNAGLIASKLKLFNESIKYFDMALKYNYPEPRTFAYQKQNYFELGDTTKGVEILKEGFTKYPESQEIVVELINYFLIANKSEEALNYIKIAQEKDPKNISLVFAEGTLYDKQGEFTKAIEIYKKAIAMDPGFFNGYFNLGVLHYNRGQQLYKEADVASAADYKKLQEQGDEQFKLVVEPMEKCYQILEGMENLSTEDKETLSIVYETLKSVYYRLQKFDPSYGEKVKEMKTKLGQ